MQQTADFFGAATKILTVGELTRNIRSLLEARIGSVWVQGEVSNYRKLPSGHQYFTLKDNRAAIACVIFRSAMVSLREPLADGAQVQVYGNVTVFEARGQYQLSVEIVQPRGLGVLQAKFEALKLKLEAEGLFDPARKKPLPKLPRRIGIVTSPSGAAIRDMLNVLRRRAPGLEILINPVRVQGAGAAAEIAAAIRQFNDAARGPGSREEAGRMLQVDLIVLTRGGGSIEDLWEFNEEIVARAIAASALPVVSAIGPEIDFTIADFAADLRAPTPSAAAELIVPDASELDRRIGELTNCIQRVLRNFIAHEQARLRSCSERALGRELRARFQEAAQQLDWNRERLLRHSAHRLGEWRASIAQHLLALRRHDPGHKLALLKQRLHDLAQHLPHRAINALLNRQKRCERASKILAVLGPEFTLRRGYSITTREDGKIVTSVGNVAPGVRVRTRVQDGEFGSEVREARAVGR